MPWTTFDPWRLGCPASWYVRSCSFSAAPAPLCAGLEVASAFWVPLERLFGHSVREVEIELGGENRRLPAYVIGPDVIWGMTYRILGSLLAALRGDPR